MAQFFQMPVYKGEKIAKWMNIERERSEIMTDKPEYSDLWLITNYPRPETVSAAPKAIASLMSVRIAA